MGLPLEERKRACALYSSRALTAKVESEEWGTSEHCTVAHAQALGESLMNTPNGRGACQKNTTLAIPSY